MHLGPNTGIYIPCESGIPLYINVLALRLDVRRGCQVALVEQIHKIYSVLPCPSPTPNLLFHSLKVREFPPFCHKRGYPPLLSPQPLVYFTPLIPCKVQKSFLATNHCTPPPPKVQVKVVPQSLWSMECFSLQPWCLVVYRRKRTLQRQDIPQGRPLLPFCRTLPKMQGEGFHCSDS